MTQNTLSSLLSEEYQQQLVDNLTELMQEAVKHMGDAPKQYPEWMDGKLAAEYVGVSRTTLSNWIKLGLAYSKVNTQARFRKSDLDGFLMQHSY
ncbi:helix-turn-helix domain-containing protein [Lacticaseibacillus parakribbianus]|uniref:helix-turn-helix domain-containing protein n=1 Tax=Lacticaseibacillus parakribbianus TaxID=2970927 RepID=UPI0021CB96DE|nr:helix-turn-helix domain-containing protein [Lacticaseibacillus parakribbianus]